MNNTLAFVTNTKTTETTRYSNQTFDHVLKFKGKYYGVKGNGIYLIGGADDAGTEIAASFTTTRHDFGSALYKRVPYLFPDTDAVINLTPVVDGVTHPTYQSSYDGKRIKPGRGIKGRYWAFTFANEAGAEMRLASTEVEVEVMTRKIS